MDLKWKCVGALKTLFIQYTNMYNKLSIVVLPLILICFCFYLFLLFKSNFFISHSTSIEFNIIDKFKDVSHMKVHNNLSENSVQNNTHVNLVNGKKKKYHVPKFMLELYEKNKGVARHEVGPDVVRGLIPTHAGPLQNNEVIEELSNNHLLVFDLPSLDKDELFVGAELKILTQLNVSSTSLNSGAKRIIKISVYDDLTKEFLFTRETEIHHYNNTWLSFDLTFPVSKILHSDYQNKFLKVIITLSSFMHHFKNKNNNKLKLSLMPEFENFEHDYPILLLSYSSTSDTKQMLRNISDEGIKRSKRNIEDDYEEETNKLWDEEFGSGKKVPKKLLKRMRNTCKKKPLYINFSEIEYDIWIVQPSGYEAYQCQGRCFFPVAEHLNPTKHAIMQALVHSVFPSRASRSCCVPTVLDSISILYVDEKGVLTYRYSYKDMVVIECGCR